MKVKVVMVVDVDDELWAEQYSQGDGPALDEGVRRYVGGLVATAEAAKRNVFTGFELKGVTDRYPQDDAAR